MVRIYLDSNDPDYRYDNMDCTVRKVLSDDLDRETGRGLDGYSYRLETVASKILPIAFRHTDLIPLEES